MSITAVLGIGSLVILGLMTILWMISLILKDSSIVDIFWGAGFVILSAVYFGLSDGFIGRQILLMTLVAIWGLRLSIYIGIRNIGKEEDFRYRKWREEEGRSWWWKSYFRVFLLQGALMLIIAAPLLAAHYAPRPQQLTALDLLGAAVWLIGFIFEAGGDWQLSRFKKNAENKGKVLDKGFWRYTRHPNYFGDAAQWWGFFLIALSVPFGFATIFAPVIMTLLLLRVSGVALLEKTLTQTKPQYREYIENTPAFFPWFPRNRKQAD